MKAIVRSAIKKTKYNQCFRSSSNVDTFPGEQQLSVADVGICYLQ